MESIFSTIAIFVLATTGSYKPRTESRSYSYLDRRLIPMLETWARYFPHTYFVLGTNTYDWAFIQKYCNTSTSSPHRHLLARTPQQPSENILRLYSCKLPRLKSQLPMKVLWVGNCTGEYFGIGPTCRCQEAMRYYLQTVELLSNTQWFIFIDDDMYFRPYALIGMLHNLSSNDPIQIASANSANSLSFAHRWNKTKYQCYPSKHISFAWAQPSILSK